MEHADDLSTETIAALEELVRINLDSCKCLAQVYNATADEKLMALLRDIGEQRKEFATQLGVYVLLNDGELSPRGTLLEELHRWWLHITGALGRGDAKVIFEAAERGEAALEQAYGRVMGDAAGTTVSSVLEVQHAAIQRSLARIRDLRRGID